MHIAYSISTLHGKLLLLFIINSQKKNISFFQVGCRDSPVPSARIDIQNVLFLHNTDMVYIYIHIYFIPWTVLKNRSYICTFHVLCSCHCSIPCKIYLDTPFSQHYMHIIYFYFRQIFVVTASAEKSHFWPTFYDGIFLPLPESCSS